MCDDHNNENDDEIQTEVAFHTKPTVFSGKTPITSFSAAVSKSKKIMPIQLDVLESKNASDLLNRLNVVFAGKFEWLQLNADSPPKIIVGELEVKNNTMDFLRDFDIQFNTSAEKGEQRLAFIVRGLNFSSDAGISQQLDAHYMKGVSWVILRSVILCLDI